MRISVFGQRTINDEMLIKQKFDETIAEHDIRECLTYVYGGAKGAQDIIYNYVKEDMDTILFRPWTMVSKKLASQAMEGDKFNPVYFFFRNIQIIDNSDLVIVFDNGEQDAEVYKVKNLLSKRDPKKDNWVEIKI